MDDHATKKWTRNIFSTSKGKLLNGNTGLKASMDVAAMEYVRFNLKLLPSDRSRYGHQFGPKVIN